MKNRKQMKLSELIATLTQIQQEHGDVDVYSHNDMIADDPDPMYIEGGKYMAAGVYLN